MLIRFCGKEERAKTKRAKTSERKKKIISQDFLTFPGNLERLTLNKKVLSTDPFAANTVAKPL